MAWWLAVALGSPSPWAPGAAWVLFPRPDEPWDIVQVAGTELQPGMVVWKDDHAWWAGPALRRLEPPAVVGEGEPHLLPGVVSTGSMVALRYPSGTVAVNDTTTGQLLWSATVNLTEVTGPHVLFDVLYPEEPEGPEWGCGNNEPELALAPHPSPDGDVVVAVGAVGTYTSDHVLHVWASETGEVRHRFVFDAPTKVLGFRADGRLVVKAARTVLALSVETPMAEPEVVAEDVVKLSWTDGQVEFVSNPSW